MNTLTPLQMEDLIIKDLQSPEELPVLSNKHIRHILHHKVDPDQFYSAYSNIARQSTDSTLLNDAFSLLLIVIVDIAREHPDAGRPIAEDSQLVDVIHAYHTALRTTDKRTDFISSARTILPFVIQLNLHAARLLQLILFRVSNEAGNNAENNARNQVVKNGAFVPTLNPTTTTFSSASTAATTSAPRPGSRPLQVQRNWAPVRFEWVQGLLRGNTIVCEGDGEVPFTRTL